MPQSVGVATGRTRLDILSQLISGVQPDLQSVAIIPIIRPYTLFFSLRIVDSGGSVFDLQGTWQAQPQFGESADLGELIGLKPDERLFQ